MASTTNEGIVYPSSASDLVPFETNFAKLAQSVDDALTRRPVRNVRNADEQALMYPAPKQGDGVFREDLGLELRYHNGTTPSKPFAGWFAQSGTLLSLHNVPWTVKNNDTDNAFYFGDKPQVLVQGSITDPGVPFRMRMSVRCEFGSTQKGTRWDLSVGAGGADGKQIAQQIDFATRVDEVVTPIHLTSLASPQVFQGTTRVAVIANNVYGAALGVLQAPNRQWKIEVLAA